MATISNSIPEPLPQALEQTSSNPPPNQKSTATTPMTWQYLDEASGAFYYMNAAGETSWDPPEGNYFVPYQPVATTSPFGQEEDDESSVDLEAIAEPEPKLVEPEPTQRRKSTKENIAELKEKLKDVVKLKQKEPEPEQEQEPVSQPEPERRKSIHEKVQELKHKLKDLEKPKTEKELEPELITTKEVTKEVLTTTAQAGVEPTTAETTKKVFTLEEASTPAPALIPADSTPKLLPRRRRSVLPTAHFEWKEKQDEYGATYFKNVMTGMMQWEWPVGFPKPAVEDAWEERIDRSNNTKFYYNRVTNKSEWVMPEDMKKKSVIIEGKKHVVGVVEEGQERYIEEGEEEEEEENDDDEDQEEVRIHEFAKNGARDVSRISKSCFAHRRMRRPWFRRLLKRTRD